MDDLLPSISGSVTVESNLTTVELQSMIAQLSVTEEGESLVSAMDHLKKALLANPAACASFLPEDIGAMVSALRKITGKDIADQMAGKKKTKDKVDLKNLTKEQEQEIIDDLF